MIRIYIGPNLLVVKESESSYRYRSLMNKTTLVLKFSLSDYVDIAVGATCDYQNETYTLLTPPTIKKIGERNIEYTLNMGNDEEHLSRYKLRNNEDGRLKWSMTARPHEFIRQIVLNLNNRDGSDVWSVGDCLESVEKTIEFNHTSLLDALSSVAEEFETEWEIKGHTINLRKVEYFKEEPLPLSYGRGNGFVSGVGRTSSTDKSPVTTLYVQGGDRNIDRSKYHSEYLLLPKSKEYEYGGRVYESSADGLSVRRKGLDTQFENEDSLELEDIYPSRVGEVTAVEVISAQTNLIDIIDSTIPESLNYNNYIIGGESMTIIFQSGMLAGREFDLKYKHNERRFEIVPDEFDGQIMPSTTFTPAVGDKYAIFGCMLPNEYICDDATKTGASWDMMKEACRYLYENEDQKFTFTGELQGIWAKENWLKVGGKLVVGGYVRFSDNQFAKDGVDIRIVGIKDYLFNPYSPVIELSNEVTTPSFSSYINKVNRQEVVIEDSVTESKSFTKRRYHDTQQTINALSEALSALSGFSEGINPLFVQTMSLLTGDESLQFVFLDAKEGNVISYEPQYNATERRLNCVRTFLRHQTLGIDSISATHDTSEMSVWEMESYVSPPLVETDKRYYLYAQCPTDTSEKGVFLLSESAIGMRDVEGYYHFLVGILNSEVEGSRSYVSLYGFTEILPARVTTDRIVSTDGRSFLDLLGNRMRIGNESNYIDWNNEAEQTLTLINASIKDSLNVDGAALLAGFKFTNDRISSTSETSTGVSAFYLNGKTGTIVIQCTNSGDDGYSKLGEGASTIQLNAYTGNVEARNGKGFARINANGVFSNNAATKANVKTSGNKGTDFGGYASIVAMGEGEVRSGDLTNNGFCAGVFGTAANLGNTPSYGGYFEDLFCAGLNLRVKTYDDTNVDAYYHSLDWEDSQVLSLNNTGQMKIYLPLPSLYIGRIIFIKQVGRGTARIGKFGYSMRIGSTDLDYIDLTEGQEIKCTYARFAINGTMTDVWLITRF